MFILCRLYGKGDVLKKESEVWYLRWALNHYRQFLPNYGCDIMATDIFPEEGIAKGWNSGGQLCFG